MLKYFEINYNDIRHISLNVLKYRRITNKRSLLTIIIIFCSFCLMFAQFGGGDGTQDDPWQISTAEHLNNIRNNLNAYYIQTADIDLGVAPWNVEEGWLPLGDANNRFTGHFNGRYFTIRNLTINRAATHIGLFGSLDNQGTIENVILTGVNVRSTGNFIGGLIGYSYIGTVRNCSSDGSVSGASMVGGLIGCSVGTVIIACHTKGAVNSVEQESDSLGGLIGLFWGESISDSYSLAAVTGQQYIFGGFIGVYMGGTTNRCYSIGRITATHQQPDWDTIGGFIGWFFNGELTGCYWNMQTSNRTESQGGAGVVGRSTDQMVYPYDNDTYVRWDFEQVWRADTQRTINNGYPFLHWLPVEAGPNPFIAVNPAPQNHANDISVALENLRWSYQEHNLYTNPVGFRVYLNTDGEFGDDDPFAWVAYQDGRENYAAEEVLPEQLAYRTTYYWKVVPTTINPDRSSRERRAESEGQRAEKEEFRDESLGLRESGIRRRQTVKGTDRTVSCPYRGDAENVPVWRFTTEVNPNPTVARNPNPPDDAEDIDITLANLGWTYTINQSHANPVGFRVYFNTTGEFGEQDEFGWVAFAQHQTNYHISTILPEQLNYATTYYWKVVPTTNQPNRNDERRSLRNSASSQRYGQNSVLSKHRGASSPKYGQNSVLSLHRGDAENVPVWSFTTLLRSPNPANAVNPRPEHLAVGVSLNMDRVTWDYIPTETHTDPVGFRVYMNTTGAFGYNAPYIWIDFEEGVETYYSTDIVPTLLDANTSYFWRVIPTTIHPDEQIQQESCPYGQNSVLYLHTTEPALSKADDLNCTDRTRYGQNSVLSLQRGDALNCPVWRFTTGSTDVEDLETEHIITALHGNYPNPFNPETTISFTLAKAGNVCITVYNISGQLIATLINDNLPAGGHSIVWNGRDNYNREAGSGIYFYRMKNGSYTSTNKMILLK